MQTFYWSPHSIVLATCTPFAVYVMRTGTEGPLAAQLASSDVQTAPINFTVDEITGALIVQREGGVGLAPSPTLSPELAPFPNPLGYYPSTSAYPASIDVSLLVYPGEPFPVSVTMTIPAP